MGNLAGLLPEIANLKILSESAEALSAEPVVPVKAPVDLHPAIAAAVFLKRAGTVAVVCPTTAAAEKSASKAADYFVDDKVDLLRDWDSYPFESVRPDAATIGRRAETLGRLVSGETRLVCLAVPTLLQKVPHPTDLAYQGITLKMGIEISIERLSLELTSMGYIRMPIIERPGEFAVRGSVVDIFPTQLDEPVRLDFFGNEIESIKIFDVTDQRSKESCIEVTVRPAREWRFTNAAADRVKAAGGSLEKTSDAHRWAPLIHDLASIIDYFPGNTAWIISEANSVYSETSRFFDEQNASLSEGYARDTHLSAGDYYLAPDRVWNRLTPRMDVGLIDIVETDRAIEVTRPPEIAGRFDRFQKELSSVNRSGLRSVLVLSDIGERDRVAEILNDLGIDFKLDGDLSGPRLLLTYGCVRKGFILPEARLAVFGYADIWPRREVETPGATRPRRRALIDFSDLVRGELLVHETHGIASFAGLTRKTVAGKTREYLMLDYAAGDRLYLPTEQIYRVSRYIGPEGIQPKITGLGSTDWLRATRKVRKSIKKLAVDLLALYAERAQASGYAFSPDSDWQRELEAAFPYEATRDQALAIVDVKSDMETAKPMDRLVCGDVGYGKTEVAVRAAFKAILDGKQVMMLVPTTILARQHFLTFKERFAPYPIRVEMLSRFLKPAEQKAAVERLKAGLADMVVGTHRLLQKDIRFKDLGLVIVDEEHRFGVNAKEKLRQLRRSVDVMTLTATPIPRTLQMSLSAVRDLSVIETPPEGRCPVLTTIGEWQPVVVRTAIRRELARGGQVFYVHNRVETIEKAAAKIQNLVPEARIIIGHGQMSESGLEKVMLEFLNREADILLCTTIIESGIDIPSANTLIIDNADRLGLAQLYQLRGRVGRGRHRGFAYLTYVAGRILTDTAVERLRTIGELTELGSGFKVALRDLRIRGAGNILGAEQHGHMVAVGFDLYCRMLGQEIDRLRGNPEAAVPEVSIELPLNAYLPESYIENENLRLETYRSIAGALTANELKAIEADTIDRFGDLAPPAANLMAVADLRLRAAAAGVVSLSMRKGRLAIKMPDVEKVKAGGPYEVKVKPALGEVIVKVPAGLTDVPAFVIECLSDIIPTVSYQGSF